MVAQAADGVSGQLSFDFLPHLPVVVQRHDGPMTSDTGRLPVRQLDERWRYTERLADGLADGLDDPRADPEHSVLDVVRQRGYGILAGYEDGGSTGLAEVSDHDDLRDEPVFKLVAGRPPASPPAPSRFENAVTIPALHGRLDFLTGTGLERLKEKHGGSLPPRVTLDLDATARRTSASSVEPSSPKSDDPPTAASRWPCSTGTTASTSTGPWPAPGDQRADDPARVRGVAPARVGPRRPVGRPTRSASPPTPDSRRSPGR